MKVSVPPNVAKHLEIGVNDEVEWKLVTSPNGTKIAMMRKAKPK